MPTNNLTHQVELVLARYPETRDSDIELTKRVWKEYFGTKVHNTSHGDIILLDDLFTLPREDNIKRIRADIQNVQQRFLPTQESVFVERAKASKEWKTRLGYNGMSISTHNFDTILARFYQDYSKPKQMGLV